MSLLLIRESAVPFLQTLAPSQAPSKIPLHFRGLRPGAADRCALLGSKSVALGCSAKNRPLPERCGLASLGTESAPDSQHLCHEFVCPGAARRGRTRSSGAGSA